MYRDGPLRRRPPEEIRYGTGKSAVGPVLVATSGKGIVTIMVRDKPAQLFREVRERFPKAQLVHDEKGCAQTLANVARYIASPFGPFKLPLDLRGTEFQKKVWREVQKIPCGKSSTYAKVAQAIGAPKAIRAVASSCTRCWFAFAVPCHRVQHSGAAAGQKREGRRYRWVDYEARLAGRKLNTSSSGFTSGRM